MFSKSLYWYIPVVGLLLIVAMLLSQDSQVASASSGNVLVVNKTDHTLTVYAPIKTYHVELGNNGSGDKLVAGDHKTPEGLYYTTEKLTLNPTDYYLGTRWARLSYPNKEDAERGLREGLINQETYDDIVYAIDNKLTPPQNTALGGGIGIHGGSIPDFGPDWTWGCVGLSNNDAENLFSNYLGVGTPVIIQK